ncbi:MAG: MFS transporter [Elusimicrobiota bacterium]|jgi:MFS family permease
MRKRSLPSRLLSAFLGAALFILAPGPQALTLFAQTVHTAPIAPASFTPTPFVGAAAVLTGQGANVLPITGTVRLDAPLTLPTVQPATLSPTVGTPRAKSGAAVAALAPKSFLPVARTNSAVMAATPSPFIPLPRRGRGEGEGAVAISAPSETAQISVIKTLEESGAAIAKAETDTGRLSLLERLFHGRRAAAVDEDSSVAGRTVSHLPELAPSNEGEHAAAPVVPAPAPSAPADGFNKKAVIALFITGTLSMASFILTSIAYPFVAAPAVGWAVYGTLMALGPLAAIATGPLNGALADKLSARHSMAINVGLRSILTLALPAFSYFGILNFWTLLLSSIANGWVLSSTMTTDNAYIRRLAGKHQETVTALRSVHYVTMQVVLGLIIGVGSIVDKWNPLLPFLISAAVHAFLVVPILWFTMPTDAPKARPGAEKNGLSIGPFLRKYGLEIAFLAGAVALYAASGPLLAALAPYALPRVVAGVLKSSLPITAALFFWVFRSDTVRALRAGEFREPSAREKEVAARLAELEAAGKSAEPEAKALRTESKLWKGRQFASILYSSFQAVLTYPLQNFALPLIATTLVGATGKGLMLGMLHGAAFFGNLISISSQVKLPELTVPFVGKKVAGQRLVQGAVLALAATWVYLTLVPGSLVAAAAAAALVAGLIALSSRLTHRGWIKFLGAGLLAIWAPYLVWTLPGAAAWISVKTAFFLTMLLYGMFTGPAAVSFSVYQQGSTRREDLGKVFGVSSSFFNTFNSMGYGLLSLAAGLLTQAFPTLLLPIGVAYVLGALLFWRAPKRLPGLPDKLFQEKEKKT